MERMSSVSARFILGLVVLFVVPIALFGTSRTSHLSLASGISLKSQAASQVPVSHHAKTGEKASTPLEINYQGWLANSTDTTGVTGKVNMAFRLYTVLTGGSDVWTESQDSVQVDKGIFNVLLGSVTPLPAGIFTGAVLYLETQVGSEILSPRKKLVSVAYAIRAEKSDSASNAIYADTADYALSAGINYVDSARVSVNSYKWNNNSWGTKYPTASKADTSGTVAGANVTGKVAQATKADTATYAIAANVQYVDSAGVSDKSHIADSSVISANSYKLQGKDTTYVMNAKTLQGKDTTFKWPHSRKADTADYAVSTNVQYVDSARVSTNSWKWNNNSWGTKYPTANKSDTTGYVTGANVNGEVANANKSDTADYALSANVQYVDSARVSSNSWNVINDAGVPDSISINNGRLYAPTGAGNVGIGTATPGSKLSVVGDMFNTGNILSQGTQDFQGGSTLIRNLSGKQITLGQSGTNNYIQIEGGGVLEFNHLGDSPVTWFFNGGNVGIGTTNPATKLDVNGVITATGGTSTNWNTAYTWGDHAAAGYQPLIAAGTTAQYWRGDKTWQTLDKAAIGLDNVENTALSTWSGSTNITTLGTITTGVWNAGAVTSSSAVTGNTIVKTGGTASQFLKADGSVDANTYITAVREVADEFTATASQTAFTLTHSPSANSKVKMYINGIRISNTAYSNTGTALTYVPANNGSYALMAGDRIQFDYYY